MASGSIEAKIYDTHGNKQATIDYAEKVGIVGKYEYKKSERSGIDFELKDLNQLINIIKTIDEEFVLSINDEGKLSIEVYDDYRE